MPAPAENAFEYLKTDGKSENEGEFNLDDLYYLLNRLFELDY
ncbi:hypothetical protein NIES4071_27460 [Calothrix sp. NIES-4071]|nr:hypothetical protein NIES4071_27460 [Calothrix sp. NIES-4071]BAZ57068.1 hypothetical protein NIES4105_27400 [Calothrix sp. NIES-4105]